MNLNELYHKYETLTLNSFLERNIPEDQLKTGSFAAVIVTEKDYVYKLWAEDKAYDEFLELCQKNQHLPFLPKIYKVKTLKNIFVRNTNSPSTIKVAKIEKLKPISRNTVDMWSEFNNMCNLYDDSDVTSMLKYFSNNIVASDKFIDFTKTAIFGFLKRNTDTKLDFQHPGNIMLRGDQYVLTDPLVGDLTPTVLHYSIRRFEPLIFGKNGDSISSATVTIDSARWLQYQANMDKAKLLQLLKLIDIKTFVKNICRSAIHENLMYLIMCHCDIADTIEVINLLGSYSFGNFFLDDKRISPKLIELCENNIELAQLCLDRDIIDYDTKEQMFEVFIDHWQSGAMILPKLSKLKENRYLYKWLLDNHEDFLKSN